MTRVFAIVTDQDYNLCPFGLNVSWSLWEDIHRLYPVLTLHHQGKRRKKKSNNLHNLWDFLSMKAIEREGRILLGGLPVCLCGLRLPPCLFTLASAP